MVNDIISMYEVGLSVDFITERIYKQLNSRYLRKNFSYQNDTGLPYGSKKKDVRKFVIKTILENNKQVACSGYGYYFNQAHT